MLCVEETGEKFALQDITKHLAKDDNFIFLIPEPNLLRYLDMICCFQFVYVAQLLELMCLILWLIALSADAHLLPIELPDITSLTIR